MTQRLLGAVVGGLDGATDKEDEQVTPAAFDRLLELLAGRMGGDDTHQGIERAVELVGIAAQRGVGEMRPAAGDGAGALEQLAQAGREGVISGIDRILGFADEMGEADLVVFLGPAHLCGEAIGDQ